MRSRYSAYATGNVEYLEQTWHANHRPQPLQLDQHIKWLGLEILGQQSDNQQGKVEFEARCLIEGRVEAMHEDSDFICENGQWLYTTGHQLEPSFKPWKPGRNEACPCGSGKKFKRCCG
jgi:SEC-C motif-containing protein